MDPPWWFPGGRKRGRKGALSPGHPHVFPLAVCTRRSRPTTSVPPCFTPGGMLVWGTSARVPPGVPHVFPLDVPMHPPWGKPRGQRGGRGARARCTFSQGETRCVQLPPGGRRFPPGFPRGEDRKMHRTRSPLGEVSPPRGIPWGNEMLSSKS